MKILITGARSGIGYEVGIELANLGHFVYLTVHLEKELVTLEEKVKKYSNIKCFKLDINSESDRNKIKDLEIDCLINNAAIGIGGSLLDLEVSSLKKNFNVNVFSSLRLSQIYAANCFVNKRKGKIIFISSLASILPINFLGSYSMTKASISMMARVLKNELKLITDDIKVKLIEPGIYNTGFNDVMIENKLLEESNYFSNLQDITLKQKKLFRLIGKDNLNSVVRVVVKSVLGNSNRFLYKTPFLQAIMSKLYIVLFK